MSAFVAAASLAALEYSGAPNNKIIQNHLNIALGDSRKYPYYTTDGF